MRSFAKVVVVLGEGGGGVRIGSAGVRYQRICFACKTMENKVNIRYSRVLIFTLGLIHIRAAP